MPIGLRRVTQTRIEAAAQQIRGFEEANDMEIGPRVVPGLGGPTCDIWSVDST